MRLRHGYGLLAALAAGVPLLLAAAAPRSSRYLVVWATEVRLPKATMPGAVPRPVFGRDFLAVFNATPGASFGKLAGFTPTGPARMAHHTNYAMPPDDILYANDWLANRTYVFNLRNPLQPRLLRQFGGEGQFSYPHSFVYLPNGNTLATFQYSGGINKAPGGLVEFARDGRVVRSSPAAAAGHPNIRPYSEAVMPQLDRVVERFQRCCIPLRESNMRLFLKKSRTRFRPLGYCDAGTALTSSNDMMNAQVSHVAQVWRLSDLKLLHTLVLPPIPSGSNTSEPRVLSDGKTVVVPTFTCGLFLVHNLAGPHPSLQFVYDAGYRTCAVPVVVGNYLVLAAQSGHAILSLDLRDPERPREVSRILLPAGDLPHWIAAEPGGHRLAITGYGAMAMKVLFASINRGTGQLRLEPQSIDFTRRWPDGWKGTAVPHGVVFTHPH